ncbi:Cytochrome oxidase assembly protein ShyY1 [Amycolatopsis arida]|uniref:SURF1-like protein n=1 Tax=Amycolatopsis arida TaxID=587909 RepID=A0A1I5WAZ7_9PSEU|nr:cytochrome oxidase assembly protein ShyY1 [Amycolatopsis arida]SFQ16851.1 Cytochrome oxidase assembly protein ShyY1 [Amycolatopsis arida]
MRFLLRPSWLALTLVVFGFATLCFTLLAPWQFDRHAERSARNAALQESFTAPPRPLAEVLPEGRAPDEHTQWQRVTLTGHYLPEHEVVARLRTVQGEPAFEVLTPLRTGTGAVVLVDRGYVRPDDRLDVPPYPAPPAGEVRVVGRVRMDETDPKARDAFADESTGGRPHSYSVDSRVVARASGLDLRPGYVQLEADQPGVLGALPLPQLDAGPFLSYALQWIAFGVMALLGWLYFTVRELRPGGALAGERPERRKSVAQLLAENEDEDEDEDGGSGVSAAGDDHAGAAARTAPPAPRS